MYAWHWVIVWLQFLHYICVCLVVVLSGIAFMLLEMVWRNVAGNSNVCSLCSFHVVEKTATKLQLESTMCFCLALFTWTFGMWRHKQTCSFTEFDLSKTFKMPSLLVCNFFGGRLLWYFCSCICFGVVLAKGWMRSQSLEARTFGCKCCWACIAFAFFLWRQSIWYSSHFSLATCCCPWWTSEWTMCSLAIKSKITNANTIYF